MKTRPLFIFLAGLALAGAVAYGGYRLGVRHSARSTVSAMPPSAGNAAPQSGAMIEPGTGRRVLYWHDPMVPGQRFDKPGKSPFMDMPLVPVYADEDGGSGNVSINARMQQNLGLRTAEVTRGTLESHVEAPGNVAYNEHELALVQARANGYLERLYVRAALDRVRKGQALAELYVPDWIAAQEDFLTAKRLAAQGDAAGLELVDAARERMRLAGMSEGQMRLVESTGKVQARMVIAAPVSGVVAELGAREGMTVASGVLLFRINGLDTVWVNADVPEDEAEWVRSGSAVEVQTPALPGVIFRGTVGSVLPGVDPTTRTVKARIELANPGQRLVPGMFATVNLARHTRKDVLLVPSEAVIRTGQRSVAIVAQSGGTFAPVDVEMGRESNGQTEIRKGLQAGQKVVVSGQFLIDSEASLRGATLRMGVASAPAGASPPATHRGTGRIEAIDKDKITISHGPIPTLHWGAMTMGFSLPAGGLPRGIKVGDRVDFEIRPIADRAFEIVSITPAAGAKP